MRKLFLYGLLLCIALLISCKEDEYVYPPVKLEFLTASSGSTGTLQTLLTDNGESLNVAEDRTQTKIDANSTQRVISNYEQLSNGGVKIYALSNVVSPIPEPVDSKVFEGGIKTDPVEIQSIWMGMDYLNIVLLVKSQSGKHLFHFVKEREYITGGNSKSIDILLYHDAGEDVPAYTKRAYASIPLRQYVDLANEEITINFSYYDNRGIRRDWAPFIYTPKILIN